MAAVRVAAVARAGKGGGEGECDGGGSGNGGCSGKAVVVMTAAVATAAAVCENIYSWISLSGDLVFSHQKGIYGFKFPQRVLEISSRDLTLLSILII